MTTAILPLPSDIMLAIQVIDACGAASSVIAPTVDDVAHAWRVVSHRQSQRMMLSLALMDVAIDLGLRGQRSLALAVGELSRGVATDNTTDNTIEHVVAMLATQDSN